MTSQHIKDILLECIDADYPEQHYTGLPEMVSTQEVGMALLEQIDKRRLEIGQDAYSLSETDFEFTWLLASHMLGHTVIKLRASGQSERIHGDVNVRFLRAKTGVGFSVLVSESNENELRSIEEFNETLDDDQPIENELDQIAALNQELANYRTALGGPDFSLVINAGDAEDNKAVTNYLLQFISTLTETKEDGSVVFKQDAIEAIGLSNPDLKVGQLNVVRPYLQQINLTQLRNEVMMQVASKGLITEVTDIIKVTEGDNGKVTEAGHALTKLISSLFVLTAWTITSALGIALSDDTEQVEVTEAEQLG